MNPMVLYSTIDLWHIKIYIFLVRKLKAPCGHKLVMSTKKGRHMNLMVLYCTKLVAYQGIYFLGQEAKINVCFDMPQVYNAIRNHGIHVATFFRVHDHYLMTTWSVKSGQISKILPFLSFLTKKSSFDMPHVYSAIKNHRIHVTTFFMLTTTIWWPHGVWKVVNFQKHFLFWASWLKKCMFWYATSL